MNYRYPCCGFYTFPEKPDRNHTICPVCFWEDNPFAYDDPDEECCCNHVSLKQARKNFAAFDACKKQMIPYVRPPKDHEKSQ